MEENVIICPKCKSHNVKEIGPFAERKKEGEKFKSSSKYENYHCLNCNYGWDNFPTSDVGK